MSFDQAGFAELLAPAPSVEPRGGPHSLEGSVIRRLLRHLLPGYATGGEIPAARPGAGDRLVVISLGRRIGGPEEAEALGLTADARRMRRRVGQ